MDNLYRIEELSTMGWSLTDAADVKLTKEEATNRLNSYLADGYNPNRLRAVPDVD